jgi:hypothetical protein
MRTLCLTILLAVAACGCRTHETSRPPALSSTSYQERFAADEEIEVTCLPRYYARWGDGFLVPVNEASVGKDFDAAGIVFEIVEPEHLAGQVVSYHFDMPEKWDAWYKPDVHYLVTTRTLYIGTLAFLCDPGFPVADNSLWSLQPTRPILELFHDQ